MLTKQATTKINSDVRGVLAACIDGGVLPDIGHAGFDKLAEDVFSIVAGSDYDAATIAETADYLLKMAAINPDDGEELLDRVTNMARIGAGVGVAGGTLKGVSEMLHDLPDVLENDLIRGKPVTGFRDALSRVNLTPTQFAKGMGRNILHGTANGALLGSALAIPYLRYKLRKAREEGTDL